jgi:endonuclease IV
MSDMNHAEKAIEMLVKEFARAQSLHGDFHSLHEGFAALLEEHDELWDLLKKKRPDLDEVIDEAIQVATMGYKIAIHAMKMKASKT